MSLFYCLPFKYILSIYCPRLSSQEVWDTLSSFQHQKVSLSHLVWTYTWHKSELWLVTPATGPDYLTELQLQQSPLTLKQGKILNPFWKVDWVSFRVWDLKYIFFMKRKETSVSSENWICFLSATRCWCFMGLPKLFTTWLCRLSPILSTYYSPSPQSVSSYTHHTGHSILSGLAGVIFYEASAISYSMSIVWVIQKRVMQERWPSKAVFFWEAGAPTTLLSVIYLLRDADIASTFLLVSLESFHKGRLKELNAYSLATGSLKKVMTMLANIWGT